MQYDRKLDALEDLIEAANGKPVMVAYWFRHDLARISERLRRLHIPFSQIDTPESIRRWNAGELPIAMVHPASAGHGLNLQSGGSAIIWFGLTWSLELYQQTNARLWRQGQKAETVQCLFRLDHRCDHREFDDAFGKCGLERIWTVANRLGGCHHCNRRSDWYHHHLAQ